MKITTKIKPLLFNVNDLKRYRNAVNSGSYLNNLMKLEFDEELNESVLFLKVKLFDKNELKDNILNIEFKIGEPDKKLNNNDDNSNNKSNSKKYKDVILLTLNFAKTDQPIQLDSMFIGLLNKQIIDLLSKVETTPKLDLDSIKDIDVPIDCGDTSTHTTVQRDAIKLMETCCDMFLTRENKNYTHFSYQFSNQNNNNKKLTFENIGTKRKPSFCVTYVPQDNVTPNSTNNNNISSNISPILALSELSYFDLVLSLLNNTKIDLYRKLYKTGSLDRDLVDYIELDIDNISAKANFVNATVIIDAIGQDDFKNHDFIKELPADFADTNDGVMIAHLMSFVTDPSVSLKHIDDNDNINNADNSDSNSDSDDNLVITLSTEARIYKTLVVGNNSGIVVNIKNNDQQALNKYPNLIAHLSQEQNQQRIAELSTTLCKKINSVISKSKFK